jgi:hypothetical protein
VQYLTGKAQPKGQYAHMLGPVAKGGTCYMSCARTRDSTSGPPCAGGVLYRAPPVNLAMVCYTTAGKCIGARPVGCLQHLSSCQAQQQQLAPPLPLLLLLLSLAPGLGVLCWVAAIGLCTARWQLRLPLSHCCMELGGGLQVIQ